MEQVKRLRESIDEAHERLLELERAMGKETHEDAPEDDGYTEVVAAPPRVTHETFEVVHFWRPHLKNGFLSNWSNDKIVEDGVTFSTIEHYYNYHKAICMGDENTADLVLKARTPYDAKGHGGRIMHWKDEAWRKIRDAVLFNGVRLKAEQHKHVREGLLNTGNKVIAMASPSDKIFGIGIEETHDMAFYANEWPGENLLGKVWMRVRDLYRQT